MSPIDGNPETITIKNSTTKFDMDKQQEIFYNERLQKLSEITGVFIKRARVNNNIDFLTPIRNQGVSNPTTEFIEIQLTPKQKATQKFVLPAVSIRHKGNFLLVVIAADGSLYKYNSVDQFGSRSLNIVSEPNSNNERFPLCEGMNSFIYVKNMKSIDPGLTYTLADGNKLISYPISINNVWQGNESETTELFRTIDVLQANLSRVVTLSNGVKVSQVDSHPTNTVKVVIGESLKSMLEKTKPSKA